MSAYALTNDYTSNRLTSFAGVRDRLTAFQDVLSPVGASKRSRLARTLFDVDDPPEPTCQGRMKLLGLVKNPVIISRTLATVGEAPEVPQRSPGRGPPYWKSRVLRRQVLGDEDEGGAGRGRGADEAVA